MSSALWWVLEVVVGLRWWQWLIVLIALVELYAWGNPTCCVPGPVDEVGPPDGRWY